MDINEAMFQGGQSLAAEKNVSDHLVFIQADFNCWQATEKYQLIMANQCLHHVVELEHLFENIHLALTDEGKFITSDVIGRNGQQRWPEALNVLKPIWKSMSNHYQYNHSTQKMVKIPQP